MLHPETTEDYTQMPKRLQAEGESFLLHVFSVVPEFEAV